MVLIPASPGWRLLSDSCTEKHWDDETFLALPDQAQRQSLNVFPDGSFKVVFIPFLLP